MDIKPISEMPKETAWGSTERLEVACLRFRQRFGFDPEKAYYKPETKSFYFLLPRDWQELRAFGLKE